MSKRTGHLEPTRLLESIKGKLGSKADRLILDHRIYAGELTIEIPRTEVFNLCQFLKDDEDLDFSYCSDVTFVDYLNQGRKPRFMQVIHLLSMDKQHRIRIKAGIDDGESAQSITALYGGANWHEREAYDMFGIEFEGHPDLRRLLTPQGFEGYPLRKDFPLKGTTKQKPIYENK